MFSFCVISKAFRRACASRVKMLSMSKIWKLYHFRRLGIKMATEFLSLLDASMNICVASGYVSLKNFSKLLFSNLDEFVSIFIFDRSVVMFCSGGVHGSM